MSSEIFPATVEPAEETKFFEYGEVRLDTIDHVNRHAMLDICMPQNLFQVVTPALLGAGLIDDFRLRDPIAVWLPKIGKERLGPVANTVDSAEARVNQLIRERVEETLRVFQGVGHLLLTPGDLVPMLPMGTYVTFKFRCKIDSILAVLEHIQKYVMVLGIAEFQWALAAVLHQAVAENESWTLRNNWPIRSKR